MNIVVAAILSPALLCAQIAAGSISVTASQTNTPQPSEAVFSIVVYAPFGASLSDVLGRLSSAGITASNLVDITSTPVPFTVTPFLHGPSSPSVGWVFQLLTPLSNEKAITSALAALENTIGQNANGFSLSFSVSSNSVFTQSPQTCNLAGLVANARTQAQNLAAAAGQSLGGIVGLTSAVSNSATTACSLVVKFAMGALSFESVPNAITINVSQVSPVPPDQATIVIGVNSALAVALDDVTGALQTAGISSTTFTGMNTVTTYIQNTNQTQTTIQWSFTLAVPVSNLGAVLAQLTTAAQAFGNENTSLSLTFAVEGASSTQPVSCSEPALLAMAQAQAQQVAAAAGVRAGAVVSLGSSASASEYFAAEQAGVFTSSNGTTSSTSTTGVLVPLSGPSSVCTMSAQFQLF